MVPTFANATMQHAKLSAFLEAGAYFGRRLDNVSLTKIIQKLIN